VFSPESIVYRSLDALANRLYRQAWRIVVTTDASREALIAKGRPPEQVAVIRNGVDAELFSPQAASPPDSAAPSGTFNLVYVGTLGLAHGLESLLDAAALLADHPDIRITLIGGGADRSQLQAQARSKGLRNVVFSGPRPWNEIPGLLAAADAALVHLNNSPLFATVLPSKMFEAMAAGTPVILGVRGEARQILERADAGIAIEPENPAQLRDAVLELQRDPKRCARLGRNGRRYALENASYESRARDYLTLLSG
jgi:glycosyltransferase involved in cell wall biosynthesis